MGVFRKQRFEIRRKNKSDFFDHSTTLCIEFLDCLKCERDICTKHVLGGAKMPFRLTPALIPAS